jgi:hypothetical protein
MVHARVSRKFAQAERLGATRLESIAASTKASARFP